MEEEPREVLSCHSHQLSNCLYYRPCCPGMSAGMQLGLPSDNPTATTSTRNKKTMKLSTTSRDSNDHNNNNNNHHHTTPNKDQLKDHDFALTFSSGGGLASPVLILGLNAALQKRIFVHNFQVHEVNRVASTDWGIGGKGQNAFYASLQLPISHPPKLIQFIGQGHEGDVLVSKLSEIASTLAQSTECFFTIRQKTSCRTCTSIIDLSKSEVTELVESTGPVTAQEVEYLVKSMEKNYSLNRVDGIAVMGSLPNGCLKTLYSDILQRVCNRHSKIVLDTVVGLKESICMAIKIGASFIVKVNGDELVKFHAEITSSSRFSSIPVISLRCEDYQVITYEILQEIFSSLSLPLSASPYVHPIFFAITNGAHSSFFLDCQRSRCVEIRLQLTAKLSVVNAIGAGDTVAACMLQHWTGQLNREELVVRPGSSHHRHHHLPAGHGDEVDQQKDGDEDFSEVEDRYRRRVRSLWAITPGGRDDEDEKEEKLRDVQDMKGDPEILLDEDPFVSFLWGLACGTASCLKEKNSQFELVDTLHFFHCFQLSQ